MVLNLNFHDSEEGFTPLRSCRWTIAVVLAIAALLSGCTVVPVPLDENAMAERAVADISAIGAYQPAPTKPVSLREALARTLLHNLDFRLEVTERELAQRELALSRYQMLPQLVGNLGFTSRSNFSGATSRSLLTGQQSLVSSTSSDRDVFTADLGMSWNILDFGISYVRAQQSANRVMMTEEQKRKVVIRLIQDVRSTYWQAVSYDRVVTRMTVLAEDVEESLRELRTVQAERLDKPLTSLTYQRELISIKRELDKLHRELSLAKVKLAALMNLPPGTDYQVETPAWFGNEEPVDPYAPRGIDRYPLEELEKLALTQRSELRELYYEEQINAGEVRIALLELLPGVTLDFGANRNNNSFLFENDWLDYGSRVSWNLLNVFKMPATNRMAEAREEVLHARRMALSMALLTQLHVGLAGYQSAQKELHTATQYLQTQRQILEQVTRGELARSVNRQSVIREQMNTLVADVKYDVAYADMENAYSNTMAAAGIDPAFIDIKTGTLEEVMAQLEGFEGL